MLVLMCVMPLMYVMCMMYAMCAMYVPAYQPTMRLVRESIIRKRIIKCESYVAPQDV